MAWLDASWAEISAAIHLPADLGSRPVAWLLVSALQDYLQHFRPLAEAVRMAMIGLTAAERAGDLGGQAAMRLSLGHANWRMTRLAVGKVEFERALALSRRVNWSRGEADALRGIGVMLKQLGMPRQALSRYRASVRLDHLLDNARGEASGLNNLASAYLTLGRLGPAEECLTACLPLAERAQNQNTLAITLVNLGLVRQEQAKLEEALHVLERSLVVVRGAGLPYGEAITFETVGRVHNDAGRWSLAAQAHQRALVIARRVENLNCQVDALVGLAEAETGLGRTDSALERLDVAAGITDRTGHTAGQVELLIGLAQATCTAGHPEQARDHVAEALRLATQSLPLALAKAHGTLAGVLVVLGDGPGAAQESRDAVRVARRSGQRLAHARALIPLGHAQRMAGDERAARSTWPRAHRLFVDLGIARQQETAALLD